MQRFEQTPRPTLVVVVVVVVVVVIYRREETRWVRCTARRTQASEPTPSAFGLAAKGRAECAA